MSYSIQEYVPDLVNIEEYPIHFGGMDLFSRMTMVRYFLVFKALASRVLIV